MTNIVRKFYDFGDYQKTQIDNDHIIHNRLKRLIDNRKLILLNPIVGMIIDRDFLKKRSASNRKFSAQIKLVPKSCSVRIKHKAIE